jgi:hypothetical protein
VLLLLLLQGPNWCCKSPVAVCQCTAAPTCARQPFGARAASRSQWRVICWWWCCGRRRGGCRCWGFSDRHGVTCLSGNPAERGLHSNAITQDRSNREPDGAERRSMHALAAHPVAATQARSALRASICLPCCGMARAGLCDHHLSRTLMWTCAARLARAVAGELCVWPNAP